MSVSELTMQRVYDALNAYWRQHHVAPTIREVMLRTGINSSSMVRLAFSQLEEAGVVRVSQGKGRSRAAIPKWVDDLFDKAGG